MVCIILINPLLLTQETEPERRIKYIFSVGGGENTVRRQGKWFKNNKFGAACKGRVIEPTITMSDWRLNF